MKENKEGLPKFMKDILTIIGNIIVKNQLTIIIFVLVMIYNHYKRYNRYLLNDNATLVMDINFNNQNKNYIENIVAIRHAAKDIKIKKLFINLNTINSADNILSINYAILENLKKALIEFKKNGKEISVWSEAYNLRSYYIASIADNIYAPKYGTITLNGIYHKNLFLKNILEKNNVKIKTFRPKNNKFKGAIETYTNSSMSDESKAQIKLYMDEAYKVLSSEILEYRNNEKFTNLKNEQDDPLSKIYLMGVEEAKEKYGLIDDFKLYNDLLEKSPEPSILDILLDDNYKSTDMLKNNVNQINITNYKKLIPTRSDVAIITLEGTINNEMYNNDKNNNRFHKEINYVLYNNDIRKVILCIDSPGGYYHIGLQMFDLLLKVKRKKELIVVQGNLAASGGYYLSVIGKIYANKLTLTGSIGVFSVIPSFKQFLENKGININGPSTHEFSDINSALIKDEENIITAKYNESIEQTYKAFKDHCNKFRNLQLSYNKKRCYNMFNISDEVASGKVWSGSKAYEHDLVDNIGGIYEVLINELDENNLNMPQVLFFTDTGFSKFKKMLIKNKLLFKKMSKLMSIIDKISL